MNMSRPEIAVKTNTQLKAPPMFKVIYVNDSKTSMQFVIDSLVDHFSYADSTAEKLANTIHKEGSVTAAILPYEIAEQKGIEVTVDARKNGYPLQIKIEQENA
jgi:ATP-dependent Clp protease adaptor protein ClpS